VALIFNSANGQMVIDYKRILHICSEFEKDLGVPMSRAQKLLLLERGTLEGLLTVLQQSPITVKVLHQGFTRDGYTRRVLLTDSKSGEELVEAESRVYIDRMPKNIAEDIMAKKLGIGEIMAANSIESRREFIEVGHSQERGAFYRVYNIIVRGETWFTVKEFFSTGLYKATDF